MKQIVPRSACSAACLTGGLLGLQKTIRLRKAAIRAQKAHMPSTQVAPGKLPKDPIAEEKLLKRAANASNTLATCLKTFLGAYESAPQHTAASEKAGGRTAAGKADRANKKKPPTAAANTKKGQGSGASKDLKAKAEAWAQLFYELDGWINKSRKCNLEDIYSAVGLLDDLEQQALSNIIAITTQRQLPQKQNEAALVIKDTLFAAAAAHSYHHQQVPDASKSTAAAFRELGLPAECALQSGFTVGQLLRAGYSTAELLRSNYRDLAQFRAAGVTVRDLYANLMPTALDGLTGSAGAARLKAAGYPVAAVQAAAEGNITTWDLRLAGYTPATSSALDVTAGQSAVDIRSRGNSSSGSNAGAACAAQVQNGVEAIAVCTAVPDVMSGRASVQEKQQSATVLKADGPWDLEYFRHGIKPLMHMQPGRDLPDLLIGTKDKLVLAGKVHAVEEQASTVKLAPHPVRLAQQRKRSGAGLMQIGPPNSSNSLNQTGQVAARSQNAVIKAPDRQQTIRDRSRLSAVSEH